MGALLRQTAATIKDWSTDGSLANKLAQQMSFQIGKFPSESEKRSWTNSLAELSATLIEANLSELPVLLEYQLPYSSKRIDAVLVGSNPKNGKPVVIAIELKQWTEANPIEGVNEVVQIPAYGKSPILHPAIQVKQYCADSSKRSGKLTLDLVAGTTTDFSPGTKFRNSSNTP